VHRPCRRDCSMAGRGLQRRHGIAFVCIDFWASLGVLLRSISCDCDCHRCPALSAVAATYCGAMLSLARAFEPLGCTLVSCCLNGDACVRLSTFPFALSCPFVLAPPPPPCTAPQTMPCVPMTLCPLLPISYAPPRCLQRPLLLCRHVLPAACVLAAGCRGVLATPPEPLCLRFIVSHGRAPVLLSLGRPPTYAHSECLCAEPVLPDAPCLQRPLPPPPPPLHPCWRVPPAACMPAAWCHGLLATLRVPLCLRCFVCIGAPSHCSSADPPPI
jgi:hypothetical protein